MNYLDIFKTGSGIHIKKKNRGKFTKSAKAAGESVQEHAHKVMNDPNATTLQKRRANFAIQAKKWHRKHQEGGNIWYQSESLPEQELELVLVPDYVTQYKSNTYKQPSKQKEEYKGIKWSDILFEPVKGGISDDLINLLHMFDLAGIKVRVTSGYRPGALTKQGNTSFHSTGEAIDIVPEDGDFSKLALTIKSNPTISNYMKSKGFGVIDETSAEMLAKTGGTGAHFHIGKDKLALNFWV